MSAVSVTLRRLCCSGLGLLLGLHAMTAVLWAREGDVVMDLAGLLSNEEWSALEEYAIALGAELGMDIVVYTDAGIPDDVQDILYDGSPLLYLAVDDLTQTCGMGGVDIPGGFPTERMAEIVEQVDVFLAEGRAEDGIRHFLADSTNFLQERDGNSNDGQEAADVTTADSIVRMFDQNNLLSDEEEAVLSERAAALSRELGIQFVLITREPNSGSVENIDFADSFYMKRFHSEGMTDGISMCLDTSNRIYSINTFGRARELVSDQETADINDSVRELMREDRFQDVFDRFLDQSSDLIRMRLSAEMAEQEKQAEIQARIDHLEVPVPDPNQKIYDYAGMFDQQTLDSYAQIAREYRDLTGVDFLFITTNDNILPTLSPYLERFYQNYRDAGGGEECVLLILDTELVWSDCVSYGELAAEFDSHDWLASNIRYMLEAGDAPEQLLQHFYENATAPINMARMLREMVIPQAQAGQHVYDFGDLLDMEEEAAIREQIAAYNRRGALMVVIAELESPELLSAFSREFTEQNGFGSDYTALYVCVPTGDTYITGGSTNYRFRGWEQDEVAKEVAALVREGSGEAGIQVYLDRMPRYMNRLLPDIDMVDEAGAMLAVSMGFSLAVALAAIGVMALFQYTSKGKPPKKFSYTTGGLALHYRKDTLVSSVTTQTERPKESDSSSETSHGGGSNSGGSSSRY